MRNIFEYGTDFVSTVHVYTVAKVPLNRIEDHPSCGCFLDRPFNAIPTIMLCNISMHCRFAAEKFFCTPSTRIRHKSCIIRSISGNQSLCIDEKLRKLSKKYDRVKNTLEILAIEKQKYL